MVTVPDGLAAFGLLAGAAEEAASVLPPLPELTEGEAGSRVGEAAAADAWRLAPDVLAAALLAGTAAGLPAPAFAPSAEGVPLAEFVAGAEFEASVFGSGVCFASDEAEAVDAGDGAAELEAAVAEPGDGSAELTAAVAEPGNGEAPGDASGEAECKAAAESPAAFRSSFT